MVTYRLIYSFMIANKQGVRYRDGSMTVVTDESEESLTELYKDIRSAIIEDASCESKDLVITSLCKFRVKDSHE